MIEWGVAICDALFLSVNQNFVIPFVKLEIAKHNESLRNI